MPNIAINYPFLGLTLSSISIIVSTMPRPWERRTIDFFITQYNQTNNPNIINRNAGIDQESPDAICELEDGRKIALELTSAYPPKGASKYRTRQYLQDLSPLRRIIERKLKNDYRDSGIDEVWLVIQIRNTLPSDTVIRVLQGQSLHYFDRLFAIWPTLIGKHQVRTGIYTLPTEDLRILGKAS